MPQGLIQVAAATKPNGSGRAAAPLVMDAGGALVTGKGTTTVLNKTAAAAALISASARRICKVIVNTAGSAPGAINDAATAGTAAAANLVFNIPNTVGIYDVDFPLTAGLVLTVGTGQVVALSYQ